jgi:hypothetical protein
MPANRPPVTIAAMAPALLAGAAVPTMPTAAAADSIVYVDQGNVWSARPDAAAACS